MHDRGGRIEPVTRTVINRKSGSVVRGWNPLGGRTPANDDDVFELLTAAVFQARFRSDIVAKRWPGIRRAFVGFRLDTVASWGIARVPELLASPDMIRSPKKIRATLLNARDLCERSRRFGSALAYLRSFRGHEDALVREIDTWAHYIGAPSIRWFVECLHTSGRGGRHPCSAREGG